MQITHNRFFLQDIAMSRYNLQMHESDMAASAWYLWAPGRPLMHVVVIS